MIIPPLLKSTNEVVIVAPSGKVPEKGLDKAIEVMEQWGLKVSLGAHVFSSDGVFSGTDEERFSDFQKAMDNPKISLILCARGGYGFARYVDKLSYANFYKNPKWVVGFSDINALHLATTKKGILTIHGPMGTSFKREGAENSILQLKELLFGGKSTIQANGEQLKEGSCKGEILGGNLSLLCDSLGTPTEIDTDNKILVLEDVGDYYYRMDRMLNQLARAGKFSNLRGLVIGDFNDMINGDQAFSETVQEMVSRLTTKFDYPIAVSMPIGHKPQNYPFVHGATYTLDVRGDGASLELKTRL